MAMAGHGPHTAKLHPNASVLVCQLPPAVESECAAPPLSVLNWQHELHVLVDGIIGDQPSLWKFAATPLGFVLASGVTLDDEDHASKLVGVATEIIERTKEWKLPQGGPAYLRICVHSGEVAAGVIGAKSLQYQVYGPVVDVAAAASETATPGTVKITEATFLRLDGFKPDWRLAESLKVAGSHVRTYEREVFAHPAGRRLSAVDRGSAAAPSTSGTPLQLDSRWDLRYSSSCTERLFAAFFNKAHAPLDLTFTCVASTAQLAWVFKWNFHHDPLLGCIMLALIGWNIAYMAALVFARPTYLQYREPLCAVSHVLHKLAQLALTCVPPGATVLSENYGAVVAILESSSFSQVAMLSYGLRLRLAWHLPVCTALLASSFLSVRPICSSNVFAWMGLPAGWLCEGALATFQVLFCFVAPCAMVYALEKRCRSMFAVHACTPPAQPAGCSAARASTGGKKQL